jgi:hypothetical protein
MAMAEALAVLDRNGLCARLYLPHLSLKDNELTEACRWLSNRGYIITSRDGSLFGVSVPQKDYAGASRPVPTAGAVLATVHVDRMQRVYGRNPVVPIRRLSADE